MRPTTRTTALPALALSTALLLGACSGGTDQAASSGAPVGDAASATHQAGDEAGATVDVTALPDPVAEVNEEQISRDTFAAAFEEQRDAARQQAQASGVPTDETVLRDDVVDRLVEAELISQEAARLDLEASDEEVDGELGDLAEDAGAASPDELLSLLAQQGMGEDQVRDELRRIVVIDKLLEERGGVEQPSEEEVRGLYDQLTQQGADGATATADPAYPAFEEVRDQLEEQLVRQNENAALADLLGDLRADAEITLHV